MDQSQFMQASTPNSGIDPPADYESTAVKSQTREADIMFSSHRISPLMHVDPETVWNSHSAFYSGLSTLLNNYPAQVDHDFGQCIGPDDADMHGLSSRQADTGITGAVGIDPTPSLSPRSSVSSKTGAAFHRSSNRDRKDSRLPDDNSPGDTKKEKYREKNREAAAKCRAKKKEHEGQLEGNHRTQNALNTELKQTEKYLRDELSFWRTQALQHTFCDCRSIQEYNLQKARNLAAEQRTTASTQGQSRLSSTKPTLQPKSRGRGRPLDAGEGRERADQAGV